MKIRFAFICIIFSAACHAQNYTRDAGIRLGTLPGVSYRLNLNEFKAIETQVVFGENGLRFRVFKQFTKPALSMLSENILFNYGYGAHAGLTYYRRYKFLTQNYYLSKHRLGPALGFDAILGLEYNIREYPLIVGINMIPFFEFSTNRIFYLFLDDAAIFIKYKF